jgi:hypothetical protein
MAESVKSPGPESCGLSGYLESLRPSSFLVLAKTLMTLERMAKKNIQPSASKVRVSIFDIGG